MSEFIYSLRKLTKAYDGEVVLDGITLAFLHGAKIGVIGHNGSGKSTLLRIMAGVDTDIDGDALPADGIKIGYVPQEPELDSSLDVRGNIEKAVAPIRALLTRYEEISAAWEDPEVLEDADKQAALMEEQGKVQELIELKGAWELDHRVDQAMHALCTPPGDASIDKLSGGERRRVALCQTLLAQPDLLLLDEPTNHLDADTVHWLERHLSDYPGTVIAITHDRYFLDHVAGWMLEMDRGRAHPYEGNYSTYLAAKAKGLRDDEKQEAAKKRRLQRELQWIQRAPKGQQAKNKARVREFEKLRQEIVDTAKGDAQLALSIPEGARLGQDVLEVKGLTKAYDGRTLFEDLGFEIHPGSFVGIVGPNGAGKTTFFRILTGQEQPDAGSATLGKTVEICYVDQSRENLDPEKSVFEEISEGQDEVVLGKRKMNARAYVSLFNFRGSDQQKLVGQLSGGQRNRVQLAKTLKTGGNLLLLDEPTNDLDVATMGVLEEALAAFGGCVMVISHDRFFLDRLSTNTLHFDGDGGARFFEGGYSAYVAKLLEEGIDIETTGGPHRRL
jgi:energy-dependent translational throttle protein EttA